MEEYIKEAEEVVEEEFFGEAYDKEWALKEEGKTEGKIEGKIEGAIDKSKEIALSMLKYNVDITLISKYTNLSISEINNLK